jgi:hypothetical protein
MDRMARFSFRPAAYWRRHRNVILAIIHLFVYATRDHDRQDEAIASCNEGALCEDIVETQLH